MSIPKRDVSQLDPAVQEHLRAIVTEFGASGLAYAAAHACRQQAQEDNRDPALMGYAAQFAAIAQRFTPPRRRRTNRPPATRATRKEDSK